jgi:mannobiose 2-epimerase
MEEKLKTFKEECLKECDNILNWWEKNTLDEENGGFIGQIDFDMTKHPEADKALVLNTRILLTYSAAYRFFKKPEYLKLADRAYNYIVEKFYDPKNVGVYWMVDKTGKPLNTRNQIFGLAFAAAVLAEYYRATEKKEALDIAMKLFDSIEKHSLDPKYNGYLDAFSQDWAVLQDMRLSPTDKNEPKTMNTHLHILIGYACLYRVHKDERVGKALKNLIELFFDKIIDTERGALNLFFDVDWTHKSDNDSYGHDMETSWLLWDAVNVLGDEEIIKKARPIVIKMVEHSLKCGYDKDGGLMLGGKDENVSDPNKCWWGQTETVIALLNAYQMTKEEKYLDDALLTWDFIKKYLIDPKDGEWHGKVSKDDHTPFTDEVKAGAWKCPYHNSRMCMEVAERVDAILAEKK